MAGSHNNSRKLLSLQSKISKPSSRRPHRISQKLQKSFHLLYFSMPRNIRRSLAKSHFILRSRQTVTSTLSLSLARLYRMRLRNCWTVTKTMHLKSCIQQLGSSLLTMCKSQKDIGKCLIIMWLCFIWVGTRVKLTIRYTSNSQMGWRRALRLRHSS